MALRKAGVKIAVVSNFDTRLRPLLRALNCDHWFDAVAVSAEVSDNLCVVLLAYFLEYSHFMVSLSGCSREAKPHNFPKSLRIVGCETRGCCSCR